MKAWLYDWGGLNLWLFHQINGWHSALFDRFMLLGTAVGAHRYSYVYAAAFVLAGLIAIYRARGNSGEAQARLRLWFEIVAVFALGFILDGVAVTWLKHSFDFPRPPLVVPSNAIHILGITELRYSLPSGHTVFATLIAASLWPALNRYWRAAAGLFVLWVALSRVVVGAHFPADVLAGFALSLLIAWLVRRAVAHTLMRALPLPLRR